MKDIQKFSGTICGAWDKVASNGSMKYYIQLEDDMVYSAFCKKENGAELPPPKDLVINSKIELEYTMSADGKYRNLESYKILGQDTLPAPTVKLPPQKALDDITLRDIWTKLLAVEGIVTEIAKDVVKLGVKD